MLCVIYVHTTIVYVVCVFSCKCICICACTCTYEYVYVCYNWVNGAEGGGFIRGILRYVYHLDCMYFTEHMMSSIAH